MAKTMTPSTKRKLLTNGQIEKLVGIYRDVLRKHRSELGSEAVQQVLGSDSYVGELVGVLRHRAEAVSDMIIRRVKVNRARLPEEAIKATGRRQFVSATVVAEMPRGEGEETDVYFFKVSRFISDPDLEKEFVLRDLEPDPYGQAAVNEADPAFADDHPNGTHWKDCDGNWCYAAFDRWGGERGVFVRRHDDDWDDDWWFAGRRN